MCDRLNEIRDPNDEIIIEIEESKEYKPDAEELFLDETQQEFEELSNLINSIIANTKATMNHSCTGNE